MLNTVNLESVPGLQDVDVYYSGFEIQVVSGDLPCGINSFYNGMIDLSFNPLFYKREVGPFIRVKFCDNKQSFESIEVSLCSSCSLFEGVYCNKCILR